MDLAAAYAACTAGCGLVDRSAMGKLALTGADAAEMLNGQVTNDVEALTPGHGLYAAFLTPKGKMRGDLRVLAREGELLLVCERVALQALFDQLRMGVLGWDAQLHKRTLQLGLLSLIGSEAEALAARIPANASDPTVPADLGPREHDVRSFALDGITGWVVRADGGVDLVAAAESIDGVRAALVGMGAVPVPEEAAEVVRVERGRPRYGIDLDETVIPQEAGLNDRAVSFTKGCYVGQETVARLHYKGKPNRHLRGLRLGAPAPTGTPLRAGEREVGRLGSSVVSPRLGPIGLALVRREAAPGDEVTVGDGEATARVVELPFAAHGATVADLA